MESFVLTLHIIACIVLICIVLMQSGHEGMGVIFGGGSSSLFGSSGAGGLLTKVTTAVAIIFLITSLSYNYLITEPVRAQKESIMDMLPEGAEKAGPAVNIEIEDSTPATEEAPKAN